MPGIWIASGGTFKRLKKAWVAQGGVFKQLRDVDVCVGGVFKDSGVGGDPVATAFYATAAALPHVSIDVTWAVTVQDVEPTDGVFLTYEDSTGQYQGRTDVIQTFSGSYTLVVGYPSRTWAIRLWASIGGEETYLGIIPEVSTAGVPTPVNARLDVSLIPTMTEAVATLSWSKVPYADSYVVLRYYNGVSDTIGVTQPPEDTVVHYQPGLAPNTGLGYYIWAVMNGVQSAIPAYVAGRSPANYAPGWYEVDAQRKRTLVRGDKKIHKQWRPASDEKIYAGHGGVWNNYGTQLGFIYYWYNNSDNPFQAIKNQLDKGARCTRVQIRLHRAGDGFNTPIKPVVRTHEAKDAHAADNLDPFIHTNWHRGKPAIDIQVTDWIDLDISIVNSLINNNGGGIVLGSTADKQADYMAFWKENTGKLRFKIE